VLVDMEGVAAEWSGFCAYWDGKRWLRAPLKRAGRRP
jgi:hypothetical protein